MKKVLLFLFFVHLGILSSAQSYSTLYNKLKTAESDTARLNTLNQLTDLYIGYKNDSAKFFNDRSFVLSRKKGLYNFEALYHKAYICRKEKKAEEAGNYAQQALELAKNKKDGKNIAKAFELLSMLAEQNKDFKTALIYIFQSIEINKELTDTAGLMSSLSVAGSIYKKTGKVTEGLKYYLEALRFAERTKDYDTQFNIYINLGTLYEQSNDSHKALNFYKNALKINQISRDENGMAICYFKIGSVYSRHKECDSAYVYMGKTIDIHLQQNNEKGLLRSLTTMAGILTAQKRFDESIDYYNRALQLSIKHADTIQIASNNSGIGYTYLMKGEYPQAIKYLQRGADIFLKGTTPEAGYSIYERLSKAYKESGDYKNAYKYHILYVAARDTTNSRNDIKKQTELKLSYEFDKIQEKQKEEAIAKEIENEMKLTREKQQRYYLWCFLILACLIIVVAVKSYISKRKANYKLEKQKVQIEFQKKLVEEKNKEISDSINYAHHIQSTCLPTPEELENYFEDYFLIHKPRDVVSGDFYWAASIEDSVLFAVADCTGHGVPGAIMSMIGSILLNEIFHVKKIYSPELVLKELNRVVKLTLRQSMESGSQDGMDIVFCRWNKKSNHLQYAGANRPLYIINELNELIEIKASKLPVGGNTDLHQEYQLLTIELKPGYQVVVSSDGFADQFGGPKFKKITTKIFKQKLLENSGKHVSERKRSLEAFFENWKGHNEQTDDVLVFSFRVA